MIAEIDNVAGESPEAELAELRRDKARLDWLEAMLVSDRGMAMLRVRSGTLRQMADESLAARSPRVDFPMSISQAVAVCEAIKARATDAAGRMARR